MPPRAESQSANRVPRARCANARWDSSVVRLDVRARRGHRRRALRPGAPRGRGGARRGRGHAGGAGAPRCPRLTGAVLPLPGSGLDRPYVLTRRVAARPVRRSRRAARAAPFTVNANTWRDTLAYRLRCRVACHCQRNAVPPRPGASARRVPFVLCIGHVISAQGDLLPRACASTPRPLDVVNPQSPTRSAFSSDRVVVNRIISCSLRRHKPRRCPSLSSLSPCPSPHAWRGRLTAAPSSSASAFRTMPTNFSFDERCPIVIRSLVHRSGREPQ